MSEEHPHRHHHAITLSLALIALVAACVLPFLMRDRVQAELRETMRPITSEQEKISARIDALKVTLESLSNKATPDGESIAELKRNVAETSTMIEVLTTRLDEAEKKVSAKQPEPAPVAAVTPPIAPAVTTVAPATELSDLKLAMLRNAPYTTELAAWEKVQAPGNKTPEALRSFAQSGIPTEAALIRDLRAALLAVQTAAPVDDVSLAGKINTHLAGLVSIKKTTASDPYAALNREMDGAELAVLVRKVEQLNDAARTPLASWLTTAKTRSEALGALTTLEPKAGQ